MFLAGLTETLIRKFRILQLKHRDLAVRRTDSLQEAG